MSHFVRSGQGSSVSVPNHNQPVQHSSYADRPPESDASKASLRHAPPPSTYITERPPRTTAYPAPSAPDLGSRQAHPATYLPNGNAAATILPGAGTMVGPYLPNAAHSPSSHSSSSSLPPISKVHSSLSIPSSSKGVGSGFLNGDTSAAKAYSSGHISSDMGQNATSTASFHNSTGVANGYIQPTVAVAANGGLPPPGFFGVESGAMPPAAAPTAYNPRVHSGGSSSSASSLHTKPRSLPSVASVSSMGPPPSSTQVVSPGSGGGAATTPGRTPSPSRKRLPVSIPLRAVNDVQSAVAAAAAAAAPHLTVTSGIVRPYQLVSVPRPQPSPSPHSAASPHQNTLQAPPQPGTLRPTPPRPSHAADAATTTSPNRGYLSPQHRLPPETMQLDFESDIEVDGIQTDSESAGRSDGVGSQNTVSDTDPDQAPPILEPEFVKASSPEAPAPEPQPPPPHDRRLSLRLSKGSTASSTSSSKAKSKSSESHVAKAASATAVKTASKTQPSSKAKQQPRTASTGRSSSKSSHRSLPAKTKEAKGAPHAAADPSVNTLPPSLTPAPAPPLPPVPVRGLVYHLPTPTVLPNQTRSPARIPPRVPGQTSSVAPCSAPPALGADRNEGRTSSPNRRDSDNKQNAGPRAVSSTPDDRRLNVIAAGMAGMSLVPRPPSPVVEVSEGVPADFLKLREVTALLQSLSAKPARTPCRRMRPPYTRPCYQNLSRVRFSYLCRSDNTSPTELPGRQPSITSITPSLPPPLYTRLPLSPFGGKVLEQSGSHRFICSVASMNGQRPSMEDAHGLWLGDSVGVFGVFDGHAGRGCAQFMGREFPPLIAGCGTQLDLSTLEQLCLDLDERFIATVNDDSGCTAAFCVAVPTEADGRLESVALHIGNIGDARVLVGRGTTLIHATEDHKPTLPGEAKRVQACGGWVDFGTGRVDGLLAVSRAFGDRRFKASGPLPLQQKVIAQPALASVRCDPDDFVVVACDGIFERDFRNEQVIEFVAEALAQTGDAAVACAALCEEALRRGSGDNMTAMVVQFRRGAGHRAVPLPPPYIVGDPSLAAAFEAFTREAGLTLAEALLARQDLLTEELTEPHVRAYPPELVQGMHAELSFFGSAPGREFPLQCREVWFRRLAEFYEAVKANPQAPQVPDPRLEPPVPVSGDASDLPRTPIRRFNTSVGQQSSVAPTMGRATSTDFHDLPPPDRGAARPANPATRILLSAMAPLEHPESSSYIPRMVFSSGLRAVYDSESS